MAGSERKGLRRLAELVAVLACAAVMVAAGASLASAGGGNGNANANGHTTGPSGPALQHRCKKDFKGNRKHRKCRHKHRGKGTLHAPGQQK